MGKVVENEWHDQKEVRECYESDSDEEEYLLAETIMDTVKNDRADVLVKLARSGVNINMPLAHRAAVNSQTRCAPGFSAEKRRKASLKRDKTVRQALRKTEQAGNMTKKHAIANPAPHPG